MARIVAFASNAMRISAAETGAGAGPTGEPCRIIPWPLRPEALKAARSGAGRDESLLDPRFERGTGFTLLRWWKRWSWRRRLARDFEGVPDGMLADVGLTRAALADYVARPFWRA